jgi:DNA processing protein
MHSLPATDFEIAAWLRLSLAPVLKPAALRLLLTAFGLPEAIFDETQAALAAVAGEAAARAALAPAGPEFDAQLDAVLAWRDLPGNQVVMLDDPAYPPALLTMPGSAAVAIYKRPAGSAAYTSGGAGGQS